MSDYHPHPNTGSLVADDLNRSLGRLEGKVDLLLSRIPHDIARDDKNDDRINAIEHAMTRFKAVISVVVLAVSGAVPIILNYFRIT